MFYFDLILQYILAPVSSHTSMTRCCLCLSQFRVLLRLFDRVTAEARSHTGQSLLSIATQNSDTAMVEFLLTHWKTCDAERLAVCKIDL